MIIEMEIIRTKLPHKLNIDKYFRGLNSCFIDIETTGLDRNKQIIYLIGLLFYDKQSEYWILNQYFSNQLGDERELLLAFMKDLSLFNNFISYNGDSFDIPFINYRLKFNAIDDFITSDNSYDLYRVIRANNDYLKLENLKLKTVEKSLGYFREDIYSGFECIQFYYDYLKDNDQILKNRILKHNSDDLFYMLDVIRVLDLIHEKKTFTIDTSNGMYDFTIDTSKIEKDSLHVKGSLNKDLSNNIKFFSDQYNVSTDKYRHFDISIYLRYGYVSEDEICAYIDALDHPSICLPNDPISKYDIPSNIFILQLEKDLYLNNIKLLLKEILKDIL